MGYVDAVSLSLSRRAYCQHVTRIRLRAPTTSQNTDWWNDFA
ncbi:MAG: hypothetical protein OJF49_003925 [Ktedonobacterales bacterium]|nr:MAG: hypothetical protein OJF49_003925 [Ktedonobacterales bacterium]